MRWLHRLAWRWARNFSSCSRDRRQGKVSGRTCIGPGQSRTTQMVDQIREAIRCARIGPGTRLPSSRRLSEQLAISRNTVVRAYDLLLMEGIVESRPASGIYVAEQLSRQPVPVHATCDLLDHIMQV